ncbi:hypothetical protein UNDKW_4080 [Undibacterium sp. KW1]|uniref:PPC domain-containing protein n=1 Tax=Undibacterium sp. KW1 TaxID=2058624 RepID=UPI001331DFF3|nr:PPC domain-containing protein [Undibacterium sp. KW1]BBB62353.1 hypothetical protein UNDKW_4080 [Undibacterium sp. KW1]
MHPAHHPAKAGNGSYSIQLSGPPGTDFDLYLYKYSGSAWAKVASSEGSTSTESVSYAGAAGYYYVQVESYAGVLCFCRAKRLALDWQTSAVKYCVAMLH